MNKGMSSHESCTLKLISSLTDVIQSSLIVNKYRIHFNAQGIGCVCYGLRSMTSEAVEVRKLLRVLTKCIQISTVDIDAQGLFNALYGMQGLSSDYVDVRDLLQAVLSKVNEVEILKRPLALQGISNALYGLQNMNSDHLEVRAALDILNRCLHTFLSQPSASTSTSRDYSIRYPQLLSNALYGLKGLSHDHTEVSAVLESISVLIQRHSVPCATPTTDISPRSCRWSVQETAAAIYGLQSMGYHRSLPSPTISDVRNQSTITYEKFVRMSTTSHSYSGLISTTSPTPLYDILTSLMRRISECNPSEVTTQAIGMIVIGLRGKPTVHYPMIHTIFDILITKVRLNPLPIDVACIGMCLSSLQYVDIDNKLLKRFLRMLRDGLARSIHLHTINNDDLISYNMKLGRELSAAIYGLSFLEVSNYNISVEVDMILRLLIEKLKYSMDYLDGQGFLMTLKSLKRMKLNMKNIKNENRNNYNFDYSIKIIITSMIHRLNREICHENGIIWDHSYARANANANANGISGTLKLSTYELCSIISSLGNMAVYLNNSVNETKPSLRKNINNDSDLNNDLYRLITLLIHLQEDNCVEHNLVLKSSPLAAIYDEIRLAVTRADDESYDRIQPETIQTSFSSLDGRGHGKSKGPFRNIANTNNVNPSDRGDLLLRSVQDAMRSFHYILSIPILDDETRMELLVAFERFKNNMLFKYSNCPITIASETSTTPVLQSTDSFVYQQE